MDKQLIDSLKNGGIGVIPTDTIYGIVGLSLNQETVEKIYKLRKRSPDKPFIILISSIDDLKKFEIKLTEKQKEFLQKNWPNPLSVVLSCPLQKFEYLHRDKNSLAFRMPKDKKLLEMLAETGPIVAPSANPEGKKPSETIIEAKKYFGNKVAFYLNGGILKSKPSTVIQLYKDGSYIVLRKGVYNIG